MGIDTIENKRGVTPAGFSLGWLDGNWNFGQDCYTVYICRFVDQFPCAAQVFWGGGSGCRARREWVPSPAKSQARGEAASLDIYMTMVYTVHTDTRAPQHKNIREPAKPNKKSPSLT